ncbi:MAG: FkbM family methyltransferase, partial [Phaeodactylibacter sp.]|nr:FkbM family methyltransferase [Phaeodactylibacter sp.]
TQTLDRFLDRHALEVDFVKMDIQGAEYQVLEGAGQAAQKGKIKSWLIGTHSETLHAKCLSWLKKHHYRILVDQFETQDQPDGILAGTLL